MTTGLRANPDRLRVTERRGSGQPIADGTASTAPSPTIDWSNVINKPQLSHVDDVDLGLLPDASGYDPTEAYGGIHLHDGSTATTVATGTDYTLLTGWQDNSESSNDTTPDAANNKITLTKGGTYLVAGHFSVTAGTVNLVWRVAVFLGGVEQDHIHWERKIATAGDAGAASFGGIMVVSESGLPVDLDVRARHSGGGDADLTMRYANITVREINPAALVAGLTAAVLALWDVKSVVDAIKDGLVSEGLMAGP